MKSTKFAVRRDHSNYSELNKYFGKLNNKKYSSDGSWHNQYDSEKSYTHDYMLLPMFGTKCVTREIPSEYETISYSKFKIKFLNKSDCTYEIY